MANNIGIKSIAHVTLVVRDYDEAIDFYVSKLGFSLVEDADLGKGKRWVVVRPGKTAEGGTALLLAKSNGSESQNECVGNQCGGRVCMFLESDDFYRDYKAMKDVGVVFCEEPREETYATVVVFQDLYGNKFDLLQRK